MTTLALLWAALCVGVGYSVGRYEFRRRKDKLDYRNWQEAKRRADALYGDQRWLELLAYIQPRVVYTDWAGSYRTAEPKDWRFKREYKISGAKTVVEIEGESLPSVLTAALEQCRVVESCVEAATGKATEAA